MSDISEPISTIKMLLNEQWPSIYVINERERNSKGQRKIFSSSKLNMCGFFFKRFKMLLLKIIRAESFSNIFIFLSWKKHLLHSSTIKFWFLIFIFNSRKILFPPAVSSPIYFISIVYLKHHKYLITIQKYTSVPNGSEKTNIYERKYFLKIN